MIKFIKGLFPLGLDFVVQSVLLILALLWYVPGCCYSFWKNYEAAILSSCYRDCTEGFYRLKDVYERPDFWEILTEERYNVFGEFVWYYLLLMAFVVYNYFYHYRKTKSIYLMKRLKNRWELVRRTGGVFACGTAFCIIAMLFLLGIFYVFYKWHYHICYEQIGLIYILLYNRIFRF